MAKYDDASWHYDGDYPDNIPQKNAATHIGMFLAWCICNDLVSDELLEDSENSILQVKEKQLTGAEFLLNECDEVLSSYDLSDLGQDFANAYYEDDSTFCKNYDSYFGDFCTVFNQYAMDNDFEYETVYHVEDTWQNYELIAKMMDQRFQQWQKFNK